ncbi:RrF2 family transcriptional regulator [Blautia sp. HCP3S3_G3]|uniref:RrF2 family transcriptional regulator n=1 Tax=Blautia sp. HCP3S3_G3 TaxID=3438913 RepID=UPI003F8B7223
MKLSKKSRYGLRALIDLAVHSANGHVSLNSIAERNAISPQYLEQVFSGLRRAGIVKSVKGAQGGYLLKIPADQIRVSDVIVALDGNYFLEDDDGKEKGISDAIQHLLIDRVNQETETILSGLTLDDLKEEYLRNENSGEDMYYI